MYYHKNHDCIIKLTTKQNKNIPILKQYNYNFLVTLESHERHVPSLTHTACVHFKNYTSNINEIKQSKSYFFQRVTTGHSHESAPPLLFHRRCFVEPTMKQRYRRRDKPTPHNFKILLFFSLSLFFFFPLS